MLKSKRDRERSLCGGVWELCRAIGLVEIGNFRHGETSNELNAQKPTDRKLVVRRGGHCWSEPLPSVG
jgi:hypothetical protein